MRKRLKIFTGVVMAALIGLLLWHRTAPSEPVWHGRPVSYWADELGRSGTNSQQAIEAFHELKSASVPFLVERLSEQAGAWRRQYDRAWLRLPAMIRSRLRTPISEHERKTGALLAIIEIGPDARLAVPVLIDVLRNAQKSSPYGPGNMSSNGNRSLPASAQLMNLNGDAVLVSGGPTNPSVVASVSGIGIRVGALPTFPSSNFGAIPEAMEMELDAIRALAAIQDGSRTTFEILIDSLRDNGLSASALSAIRQLLSANRSSRTALLAALRGWRYTPLPNELPPLARAAVLLGLLVQSEPEFQTLLFELLSDPNPVVRANAVTAIRNGNLASTPVFLALCGAASDTNDTVRSLATGAIVESERHYQGFWTLLLAAAKDPRVSVRLGAAEVLGQLGEPARRALPYTKAMLQDSDPAVRARAAKAIGKLGSWGKGAVPELKLAAEDPDEAVRKAALDALTAVE